MSKKIVIGIPSFRRPQSLTRLLHSIAAQQAPFVPHVLVADNEGGDGAGLKVVEQMRQRGFPFPLTAIAVPERGLSQVRNALLKTAFEDLAADAMAMVDDDERVEPEWIASLVAMQEQGNYDLVGGRVETEFEHPPPRWIEGLDVYFCTPHPPGDIPIIYGAGNVLLNRTIHSVFANIRFDPSFGLTGGEDSDFFFRLKAQGARFGFAPRAISHEFYHASRMTRYWASQRKYRIASNETRRCKEYIKGVKAKTTYFAKLAVALILAPILALLLFWSPKQQMRAVMLFARQLGKLNGLFGKPPRVYEITHGK